MNLTQEQIEAEFERQVRLCKGIGRVRMVEIVNRQFGFLSTTEREAAIASAVEKGLGGGRK
jgi:hypothetical protein